MIVLPWFNFYKDIHRPLLVFKTNSTNTQWQYEATSSELFMLLFLLSNALSRCNYRGRTIKPASCVWPPRRWCAQPLSSWTVCVRVWPPQSTRSHNFSSALLSSGCRFPTRSCWLPSSYCFVSLLEVWPHQTLHTADAHISTHGCK